MIHDLKETIDVIVEMSHYPVSIIIIGLGDEDFSNMEVLDGDTYGLADSNGRYWVWDIVQFVKFNDWRSQPF